MFIEELNLDMVIEIEPQEIEKSEMIEFSKK